MYDRRAKFVNNYDGDSVVMMLDQGFMDTKTINIRLANVWAPELREPGGELVAKYVADWFLNRIVRLDRPWPFLVITYRTRSDREQITLGRYVADVLTVDGEDHLNSDVMRYISEKSFSGGTGAPARDG